MNNALTCKILFAEDDDGHANLVERNLRRAGITNEVIRVGDGQEALDYLEKYGPEKNPDCPPLVMLLDIRMPRVDGYEVLRQVKSNPATEKIPIIMVTTTDNPKEIQRCYDLGCNIYVTKPVEYADFVEAIRRLGLFLAIIKVPE